LVGDEAALATHPNTATAIAAWMDDLKGVHFAGDDMQMGPPPLARRSNECYKELQLSLFSKLLNDRALKQNVMLRTQYRMRPIHSSVVSKIWYRSQLINGDSVEVAGETEGTLDRAFRPLLPVWNQRLRFAVDVGGFGVQSNVYGGKGETSLYNVHEANLVLDTIDWLLNQPAGIESRPVSPDDICVITPYSAQMEYIRKQLGNRFGSVIRKQIRVLSTIRVQSDETEIVLLSLVRNVPDAPLDLGFIMESKALNVAFSRVKTCLMVFGNFREWASKASEKNPEFNYKRTRAFKSLVMEFSRARDIISATNLRQLLRGETVDERDRVHIPAMPT
jgi:superfamily I DNA and/or RNA helicase